MGGSTVGDRSSAIEDGSFRLFKSKAPKRDGDHPSNLAHPHRVTLKKGNGGLATFTLNIFQFVVRLALALALVLARRFVVQ